jgi:hypothetical protein
MSKEKRQAEAFLDLLVAAMKDAAVNMELTQLKTQIDAEGNGKIRYVRIIVVPEAMEYGLPGGLPIGSTGKG